MLIGNGVKHRAEAISELSKIYAGEWNDMNMPFFQRVMRHIPFGIRIMLRVPIVFVPTRVKSLINGHRTTLNLREGIQRTIFFDKYETTETLWFNQCVGPGDVVFDVGANFGYYTSLGASLVGSEGRVYAFEPSPLACASIEEMIQNSSVHNIVLVQAAVGQRRGTVQLQMPNTPYLHTPSILPSDPNFAPLTVKVITLDDFTEEHGIDRIKLLKIDVEGYEPDVLAGMPELLRQRRVENMFCEFNSSWLERNGTTSAELISQILDAGYVIRERTPLKEGLPCHDGISTFSLQDIWFTLA